jgi:hypothetical protein
MPGPPGTVIAGFANGLLGLWNLDNGARLYATRLHGPIRHLLRDGPALIAATELGDHRRLDLGVFDIDHCALLRAVWRAVPVAWENGLLVRRPPPADHPCAGR